ncbi:MAG: hypothetical protein P8020_02225 [Acidobacteriota bacterium]
MRIAKLLFISLFLSLQLSAVRADVQVQQKSQIKFTGFMGKMMGMFGGRAAKEGLVTTEAVVGNRKLSRTGDQGQIIDLDQEKVYQVDWRKKRYTVTTFDEMREQMKKAAEQMKSMSQPEESEAQKGNASDENQYEVDLDTQETGQTRQINGYDTREVVMTITTRKKGKTLEEGGGMVMTTHLWLTKTLSGMDEIQDFNRRYAEKISSPFVGSSPEQFAVLSGMYPAMQQAMAKYQSEEVDMSGTPVLTSMTIENVAGKEQMESQNQPEEESPKSLGGLFGGLGKQFGKKKSEGQEDQKPGRSTVMTMTNELLSASTNVSSDAVDIPSGFKEK